MEVITVPEVAIKWGVSQPVVRAFLKDAATPVYTFRQGRGSAVVYSARVLDLKEQFDRSRKPKQDLRKLAEYARAVKTEKRKSLENRLHALTTRVHMLERILAQMETAYTARPSNGAHYQEARA